MQVGEKWLARKGITDGAQLAERLSEEKRKQSWSRTAIFSLKEVLQMHHFLPPANDNLFYQIRNELLQQLIHRLIQQLNANSHTSHMGQQWDGG